MPHKTIVRIRRGYARRGNFGSFGRNCAFRGAYSGRGLAGSGRRRRLSITSWIRLTRSKRAGCTRRTQPRRPGRPADSDNGWRGRASAPAASGAVILMFMFTSLMRRQPAALFRPAVHCAAFPPSAGSTTLKLPFQIAPSPVNWPVPRRCRKPGNSRIPTQTPRSMRKWSPKTKKCRHEREATSARQWYSDLHAADITATYRRCQVSGLVGRHDSCCGISIPLPSRVMQVSKRLTTARTPATQTKRLATAVTIPIHWTGTGKLGCA